MICGDCIHQGKIHCHEHLIDEDNCTRFEPRYSAPKFVAKMELGAIGNINSVSVVKMVAEEISEKYDDAVIQTIEARVVNDETLMVIGYNRENLKAAISRSQPRRPRIDSRDAYCPQCGKYVGYLDGNKTHYDNFCSECGQRIDGRIE